MLPVSIMSKEVEQPAKVDEYKSSEGVRFRAKLMGNTTVEELRGKNVAENAMAKLKLNIMKQKQHKTRVSISLKWDGFFVYLSDGGQELLHSFALENISFVWKDPCDNRALGIIRSEGSAENNTLVTKFFGYKTEKLALPLILALKELFGLRANEFNEVIEEKDVSDNGNDKKEETGVTTISHSSTLQEDKNELRATTEDLLNLKIDLSKTLAIDHILSEPSVSDSMPWNSFSNVNIFPNSTPAAAFQPSTFTVPSQWQPNPTITNQMWTNASQPGYQQFSNPFNVGYPPQNQMKISATNPFDNITSSFAIQSSTAIQPLQMKATQPKISKNHVDDLFSDLLPSDYGLETSIGDQNSKNPLNSNGKEIGKPSLMEMKNRNEINSPMDLSFFDANLARSVPKSSKSNIESNSMPIPLFQFD